MCLQKIEIQQSVLAGLAPFLKKKKGTNAVCIYKSIGFTFSFSLFDKKVIPFQHSVELACFFYKALEMVD